MFPFFLLRKLLQFSITESLANFAYEIGCEINYCSSKFVFIQELVPFNNG